MSGLGISTVFSSFRAGCVEALDWPSLAWLKGRHRVLVGKPDGSRELFEGDRPIASSNTKARFVALELPADQVLFRDVTLPALVEADLRHAVKLDVERSSPFAENDTVWGWGVLTRSDGQVKVRVAMASRASVHAYLAAQSVRSGAAVEVWAQSTPPVLLDGFGEGDRRGAERRLTVTHLILLAVFILGFFVMALVPFFQQRAMVFQAQAAFAALEQQTAEARTNREALLRANAIGVAVNAELAQQPDVLGLLEALTRALPDSVHVTNLQQSGDLVQITGQGRGASSVVDSLGGNAAFSSLRPTSAITRIDNEGTERFSVEFNWRGAVAAGAPGAGS